MSTNLNSAPIVVGVDGSVGGRIAVTWGTDEAVLRGVPLHLVHAWRPLLHDVPSEDEADAALTARTHGETLLAAAQGVVKVTAPGLFVVGQLSRGRPSAVLLEAAVGARMLVVGARGIGGSPSTRLGSVGLHVTAHASCTTVVVRGHQRSRGRVVAGIDGSPESKRVLAAAFEEALVRQSRLLVVSALYVHPAAEGVTNRARALDAAAAAAEIGTRPLLREFCEQYPEVDVESIYPIGYPAEILVTSSAAAQLLVIGAHGGGGFVGMHLGSIAHAIVHEAGCPVMVVRESRATL
jgi:nucleotide-binding universal stress UspA family protein